MRQVEDDRQRVEERRGRAAAALAATIVSDAVDALTSAVDHARALGADADARCDALRVKLNGATRRADAALAERQSVVQGKRGAVSVALGGGPIIKKKTISTIN